MEQRSCPVCQGARLRSFYQVADIPAQSCLLMESRSQAIKYPRGNLELLHCRQCGFIFNGRWQSKLLGYDSSYEETQHFSETFHRFARHLAKEWIDRHQIRDKSVVEIGCGKADFLSLVCRLGNNRGIGIDPSCDPRRLANEDRDRIQLIPEYFSKSHASLLNGVIFCRHTLEHIADPVRLLRTIRQAVDHQVDPVLLLELPDTQRILEEVAFWDVYYEHCSYFTLGSLARMVRSAGFYILELKQVYNQQYLILDASLPRPGRPNVTFAGENDLERIDALVDRFEAQSQRALVNARKHLQRWHEAGRGKTVLWGAGSKCVAFCTTLGLDRQIMYAVDINPNKQGRYLPGTGHPVVAPQTLRQDPPDQVVVMNPIYIEEVTHLINQLAVTTTVLAVNDLITENGTAPFVY